MVEISIHISNVSSHYQLNLAKSGRPICLSNSLDVQISREVDIIAQYSLLFKQFNETPQLDIEVFDYKITNP